MKKAALHNLGCKVNAYETDAMQQLLIDSGYIIVPFNKPADVYVINTCSVTNIADKKSRQMIHRAKKQNPNSIVVAAGCYVQTASEEVMQDLSVDIIIGNNKKHELIPMISNYIINKEKKEANRVLSGLLDIGQEQDFEKLRIQGTSEHTRAFLKVQDGCNQFCSYCIIPYARGRVRSREITDILEEVNVLAGNGYKEIVLTGIHLSSYGIDKGDTLLHLIQEVHEINGIKRIRLGSLEPKIITEEFVKELSKLPKLCPHFHLSLQSGSDATLLRMNRTYCCEDYRRGCKLLRQYFVNPALTTDIITGFPGETKDEFEETRAFIEEIKFFEVHIFKYSRRQGTKAAKMEHQIDESIKAKRSGILFEDTNKMKQEYIASFQGKMVEILIEEENIYDGQKYYTGYTKEYIKAFVPSKQPIQNRVISGKIKTIKNDCIFVDNMTCQKI